ncbi:L-threonine 3-dehydrogenase [candidate division KSB1 bacterium]|nr:L-threonine 3-dehydrogenase [candidate division KSB1 bacterium]
MKAVMKMKPGEGAELKMLPIPAPGAQEVLVKVHVTSICGSDLHVYKWNKWAEQNVHPPQIMGHELAGEVVECGPGIQHLQVGDFISAETHLHCGFCKQCRTGNSHICKQMKILGVHTNGAFAEYVVIPEKVAWKNHPSIPHEYASVQEPLGNAIDTVLNEDVAGKMVAIIGAGPVGILAAGVAKVSGATDIFITDINDYRLDIARQMGATKILNPQKQDVVREVLDATDGDGVDVVLEMSGNETALIQGCQMLTRGGRLSLLGVFDGNVNIDLNNLIIFKGIRVYGVTGREMFSTWYKAANFLRSKTLDLAPAITHKFKLEEFEKGFELMKTGMCGKIILTVT